MNLPSYYCKKKSLLRLAVSLAGLYTLFTSAGAMAQVDQSEISQLRAQISALSSRLEQLETSNTELKAAASDSKTASTKSSWADNIKISGDLRTRYEGIDDDAKASVRDRARIRARLGITDKVNDEWTLGLGLASGSDDPISTNQTLGSGASTKSFGLDYAYFEYRGIDKLMLTGGKYKNVFFKPGGQNMIFDGDYRPEGLALKYSNNDLFFNAATMYLESDDNAGKQDVESLWGLQMGYKTRLDSGSLTVGASYYDASVKGSNPFYKNLPYGNSVDAAGKYLNDYHEMELFAEGSFSIASKPVTVYGDYVQNLAAATLDTGWSVGAKLGAVSGAGTWELGYAYQDLEADAVLGSMTDSDFAGGGTDGKGHIIDAVYGLGRNTEVGLTYFINDYGNGNTGKATDYNRLHLFLSLSF